MDYAQEQIATLHDLTDPTPDVPLADSAVVVPIRGDSTAAVTPTAVFETLAAVGPGEVVVPLRAPAAVAAAFREWVADRSLPVTVLWCGADAVDRVLADHGLDGESGKGRDVWLGLGVAAARAEYVAFHDADATTYDASWVPRLLAPLAGEFEFVKGYYARVEDGRLYGRLARLFVAPLLRALGARHDDPFLGYLSAFRYPLAGEAALTARAARQVRAQRAWGLELGLLGETYEVAGPSRTAQVDLGVHRHDHRPVGGSSGLSSMADQVGAALFRALQDHGIVPDHDGLSDAYREHASVLVDQYAADAGFNGLDYDAAAEREQVEQYAASVRAPGPDTRLPAWRDTELDPASVVAASQDALADAAPRQVESD
jgi:glucosyl-3-phosphoglycerate synthase